MASPQLLDCAPSKPGALVGDGSTQLLTLRSGAQLIVMTCPYYRSFQPTRLRMIALCEQAARLRDETHVPCLVLHHEPSAEMCPPGSYTATHSLSLRLHTYHPDFVFCGHLPDMDEDFAVRVHGTWVFNAGQSLGAPRPNHIIFDLVANSATCARRCHFRGILSWLGGTRQGLLPLT